MASTLLSLAAFAACVSTGYAREGMMMNGSPAMAPSTLTSSSAPKADLLFIISAMSANFTSPKRLTLGGVQSSVAYTDPKSGRAGIYPTGFFANSSDGAAFTTPSGDWLGAPQGVLYGTSRDGNMSAVLLNLASPTADAQAMTVTFNVEALPAAMASAKFSSGAVSSAIKDAANSLGPMVLSSTGVDATTELRAVALFIDTTRLALNKAGETKDWDDQYGHHYGDGGGGWNNGYNNGGWNNGYNNGWNNGGGWQPGFSISFGR